MCTIIHIRLVNIKMYMLQYGGRKSSIFSFHFYFYFQNVTHSIVYRVQRNLTFRNLISISISFLFLFSKRAYHAQSSGRKNLIFRNLILLAINLIFISFLSLFSLFLQFYSHLVLTCFNVKLYLIVNDNDTLSVNNYQ